MEQKSKAENQKEITNYKEGLKRLECDLTKSE